MTSLPLTEDLYATLGVRPDASHAELKSRYQALVRATHPDKLGSGGGGAQFQLVQRAWRILGSPETREAYDREAAAARLCTAAVEDELPLSELQWRDELGAYWRDCRCGDGFLLPRDQVTPGELLVQCDSCSLTIRVLVPDDDVTER